jgi:p-aminobenzoyl-glutamate transporter AbgT
MTLIIVSAISHGAHSKNGGIFLSPESALLYTNSEQHPG